jgi:hypothetical protein
MVMTLTEVTNPNCGYLKQFEHIVDLHNNGVPSTYIEWCNANCEYHWGWHFWQDPHVKKIPWDDDWVPPQEVVKGTKAYMSFESLDEMVQFKLICLTKKVDFTVG